VNVREHNHSAASSSGPQRARRARHWAARYIAPLGAALALIPLGGCQWTTAPAVEGGSARVTPFKFAERAPVRHTSPDVVRPLYRPRWLKGEDHHPRDGVYTLYRWTYKGCEWHANVPDVPDASAGVIFHKGYDLSFERDRKWLTFQLKPYYMASQFSLCLVDDEKRVRSLPCKTLDDYRATTRGDWAHFLIPLEAFDGAPRAGCPETKRLASEPLDWSRIRGLKLTRLGGNGEYAELVVRDLMFQSKSYYIPRLYAEIE